MNALIKFFRSDKTAQLLFSERLQELRHLVDWHMLARQRTAIPQEQVRFLLND